MRGVMGKNRYLRLEVENMSKFRDSVFTHVELNTNDNRMRYLAFQGHVVDICVAKDEEKGTPAYTFPARLLQVFYLVGGLSILSKSFIEYETEGRREIRDAALLVLLFKKEPNGGS